VNRTTQTLVLHQRTDGKNFTMSMIVDIPEQETWLEYVGFKVPVAKNGLKVTLEFENYLTHDEDTGLPLERPTIYNLFEITVKVRSAPIYPQRVGEFRVFCGFFSNSFFF
jgi:hypothetical protein